MWHYEYSLKKCKKERQLSIFRKGIWQCLVHQEAVLGPSTLSSSSRCSLVSQMLPSWMLTSSCRSDHRVWHDHPVHVDVKMLMKAVTLEFLTSMIWKEAANALHFSLNCLMMVLELSTPTGGNGSLFLLVLGAPTSLVVCIYIVYTSKNVREDPKYPGFIY